MGGTDDVESDAVGRTREKRRERRERREKRRQSQTL